MCVIQVYKNYFVTQIGRQIKWWDRLLSDVIHIQHCGLVMGGTEILRHGKYRRKVPRYSVYHERLQDRPMVTMEVDSRCSESAITVDPG